MNSTPQQIFIVSTGRCGSTLLSSMFEQHPDILSLSEFFMAVNTRAFIHTALDGRAFWRLLSQPHKPMSQILTPQTCPNEFKYDFSRSNLFTQETLPPILYMALPRISDEPEVLFFEMEAAIRERPFAPLSQHYDFLFDWLCRRLDKKAWIERSGASLIFVDVLSRLYPDAKFIHLYRDGRDVALSMQSYPPLRLLARSWRQALQFGVDILEPPFRIGDSRFIAAAEKILAPIYDAKEMLRKRVEIEMLGAFWSKMIVSGLNSLEAIPASRKLTISYENLTENPWQALDALVQFIGPSFANTDWLEQAEELIKPARSKRSTLSAAEAARLEAACAPGLAALGIMSSAGDEASPGNIQTAGRKSSGPIGVREAAV